MSSKNPLEIPEILDMVASYLNKSDLARYLRVSKTWKEILLPHRWRRIHRVFKEERGIYSYISPEQEVFHRHRYLIHDLKINGPPRMQDMCTLPNLRSLQVNFQMGSMNRKLDPMGIVIWDLAYKFPSLHHLSLQHVFVEYDLYLKLSEHPRLRSLSLYDAAIEDNDPFGFLEACKNLESLTMGSIVFQYEPMPVPDDVVFERMRRLDVCGDNWTCSRILAIVFHCPMLESIQWETDCFKTCILIHHPVQKNYWTEIDNIISRSFGSAELAPIVEGVAKSLGKMTEFCLRFDRFVPFKALGLHFSTLVSLSLFCSSEISSGIQDVLCSCPKLEILHARYIFAKDIVHGGSWVCQQLRDLRMCFRVGKAEQDMQHLIFERLSTLVRLETLDMGIYPFEDDNDDGVLAFRLDCGLAQLATLRELTSLGFYRGGSTKMVKLMQQLGRDDVEWMRESWAKLKIIYGRLNEDMEAEAELEEILISHGVGC
ncbi:hypothetical protein BGX34_002915 [Mortierella sp. NVP85]|nr:hypothetical protein BGX34_002915 [Mortierella sp. NVP85]